MILYHLYIRHRLSSPKLSRGNGSRAISLAQARFCVSFEWRPIAHNVATFPPRSRSKADSGPVDCAGTSIITCSLVHNAASSYSMAEEVHTSSFQYNARTELMLPLRNGDPLGGNFRPLIDSKFSRRRMASKGGCRSCLPPSIFYRFARCHFRR
jgi:hypothetical protein